MEEGGSVEGRVLMGGGGSVEGRGLAERFN